MYLGEKGEIWSHFSLCLASEVLIWQERWKCVVAFTHVASDQMDEWGAHDGTLPLCGSALAPGVPSKVGHAKKGLQTGTYYI